MTEKDIEQKFTNLITKLLPDILRNLNNSVRTGTVQSVDLNAHTIQVMADGTGGNISGVRYSSTVTPVPGMQCVLLSADPTLRGRVYAIVFN